MAIINFDTESPGLPADQRYWVAESASVIGMVRHDRRQHLVRLGAARRQRMDRDRRALADPGHHPPHRSGLSDPSVLTASSGTMSCRTAAASRPTA